MKKFIFLTLILLTIFTHGCSSTSVNQEKSLTHVEAKELIQNAFQKVEYLLIHVAHEKISNESLRIIDEKLNSQEKILLYLEEFYTKETAKNIYETLLIDEIDGEIFIPLADYILSSWYDIEVKKINYNGNFATVAVEFSSGSQYEIKLKFVSDKWYVDQIIV